MTFNSFVFFFAFLPVALATTWALGRWRRSAAKLALVVLSLGFYAAGDARHLPLLLLSFAANYGLGVLIRRALEAGKPRMANGWLVTGVALDLALLIWFKYAVFVGRNLEAGLGVHIGLGPIALPLAISFFTFQEIAYLVDTSRGEAGAIGVLDFALFASFFPRLIAGPIVRFHEVVPQFRTRRFGRVISRNVLIGLVMFAIGLFKKTVIADTLAPYVNHLYAGAAKAQGLDLVSAWTAALAFTFQVYFDFSGYSDMALGVSRMFGVKLPLNFHSPLRAGSIIDYWRRWHMTLQRFVVTYVFQPLSLPLNRVAARRRMKGWNAFLLATAMPIFVTFVLLGIWHGAGWTFAAFGAMHGVYLGVNEAWRERQQRLRRRTRRAGGEPRPTGWAQTVLLHVLTLAAILYANVMFRAASVGVAVSLWGGMSGLHGLRPAPVPLPDWGLIIILALSGILVFLFPNSQQIMSRFDPAQNWALWRNVARAPISWTWKPSIGGLVFAGVVLFFGLMFIQSGPAVFLYFNF